MKDEAGERETEGETERETERERERDRDREKQTVINRQKESGEERTVK